MSDFFKWLGWSYLRLFLGIPMLIALNFAVSPWRRLFEPLLLPIVGDAQLDLAVLCPLLLLGLGFWAATVKLAERIFGFRFPD